MSGFTLTLLLTEAERELLDRVIASLYPNGGDAEILESAALKVIFQRGAERILEVLSK